MTLNDNPRVSAERRYKMLRHRREWLRRITRQAHWPKGFDLDDGWDYNQIILHSHLARMRRLKFLIETELAEVKRVLKAFGWKE